mgnify:CR=1 FL=1
MVAQSAGIVFTFDPHTLYSLDELREGLLGIVELPPFVDRLGLRNRRMFRDPLWDWESLEASGGRST